MQFPSPDPFHDRQARRAAFARAADCLLLAGAILAAIALVLLFSAPAWRELFHHAAARSSADRPVAP